MPDRFLWLALSILLTLSGCGGEQRPERIPVSGQVLIDGEPLKHGFVRVIPENGRPASSKLDSEGRFQLTTFEKNDGCLPGTHKVAVLGRETVSPTKQIWHAPKKYMSPETSGLTVTVDEPTDEVVIELESGGQGPIEETFEPEQ